MPATSPTDRPVANRLVFLGHSTVLVEMAGTRLLTDPVLGHVLRSLRRRAEAVPAAHLADVDAIFISHAHFDHLDLPSLRAIPGRPQVIVPAGLGHVLQRADLGPVHEVRVGDRLHIGRVDLEIVPAAHGGRRSPWAAADAIGCLVSAGSTVYFAGDTDLFPAMKTMAGRVDVALLPVGGWGPRLGRGHLDPRRAAEAAALIQPTIAVPIHWGTLWPMGMGRVMPHLLQRPPLDFEAAAGKVAPDVKILLTPPGETVPIPR